jgi:23S rRNA pseudouridine2605 synthase
VRLAKYLAHAGVASRRASEQLVFAGRVSVGDEVVRDPARDVDGSVPVTVDGKPVRVSGGQRAVYAVNKPRGVVSTARDPQGRPTVVSLVPSARRLYPVGRLDADTTGALLLTNDGQLAHRLAHPRYEVEKVYVADVEGAPSDVALRALANGIELDDGRTAPARVRRLAPSRLELVLHEGRNRQVRRMCEAVGHPVRRLHRSRYAGLTLGRMRPGEWRELTADEVAALRRLVGLA